MPHYISQVTSSALVVDRDFVQFGYPYAVSVGSKVSDYVFRRIPHGSCQCIRHCGLFVAVKRASEIDWTGIDFLDPFLLYKFDTGKVLPSPLIQEDVFPAEVKERSSFGDSARISRVLSAVYVIFATKERTTLVYNRRLAQKIDLDDYGTGSDRFLVTA